MTRHLARFVDWLIPPATLTRIGHVSWRAGITPYGTFTYDTPEGPRKNVTDWNGWQIWLQGPTTDGR